MLRATCLLILVFIAVVRAADLYKTLELSKFASDQDIKKAYKRLSKKYHPDKNTEEGAEDRFVKVAHAYDVLSDPTKREIYDRHGEEGLKAHEGGQQHHTNPFDMFSSFFGSGGHQQQVRRGHSSLVQAEVDLKDIYKGASIDFSIKKKVLCDHCRGSGAASDGDIHQCPGCNGQGVRLVKQQIFPGMFAQSQATCTECGGRGRIIKRQCPHCRGQKVLDHDAHYTLEIGRGMPEEHEIVYEGEADESPDWEPGDVIVKVRSRKEYGGWRRKESGLYWKETIGIDEALLGLDRNLTHLDGHIVRLLRKGVTQPGYVQKIEGEGMPIWEGFGDGDLFVEYNVVLPVELSADMRRKLAEAFYPASLGHPGKDEL